MMPGIRWPVTAGVNPKMQLAFLPSAGGGKVVSQSIVGIINYISLAGILLVTGVSAKNVRIKRTGILASAGAAKKVSKVKRTGTLAAAGAVLKRVRLLRSGILSAVGAVARSKASAKVVSGVLAFVGLARKSAKVKRTGILASSGSAKKASRVRKVGNVGFSGASKKYTKVGKGGMISSSGGTRKKVSRFLSGKLVFRNSIGGSIKATVGALTRAVQRAAFRVMRHGGS
jgi:hypothetical protein